jgi:exonuclease SbcC
VRPLKLAIEGFTAFRDRQEIDFEVLDLFVITGPTGAGKTSILDAMVFALYGRIPRLGGTHGTSDFVSLGKVEARVSFEFSVDGKGRYRVARRLSRRAPQSATLERLDGDAWVSACERSGVRECNRVLEEDLLVLDYDSFCKAVVLPQGEFHRFLKGDAAERRKVLVSLLGVGYVQKMAEVARARRTRLTAGVERTEEILAEQYADATQERLDELRADVGVAADRFSALSSALTDADKRMREAAQHDAVVRALEARRDEFVELAAALRAEVEACKAAEDAGETATDALRTVAAALEAAQEAAAGAEAEVSALEADVGTLDHLGEVAAAAGTLSAVAEEEEQARARVSAAEQDEADAARALESVEAADVEAKRLLADAVAAEQQAAEGAELAGRAAESQERSRDQAEARAGELDETRDRLSSERSAAEGARREADRLRGVLAEATEHLEEHRRANAVAELAEGAAPGDPCPVCAVPLSASIVVAPDVGQALERARAAEQTARAAAESASEQATRAGERAEVSQTQVAALERQLTEALQGHPTIEALRAVAQTSRDAAENAEAELALTRAARIKLDGDASTVHERLLEARETLVRRRTHAESERRARVAIQERRAQAESLLVEHFGGEIPTDAPERVAAQRTRLTAAASSAREARARRDEVARSHDEASSRANAAERRLAQIDLELTKLRTRTEAASISAAEFLDAPLADRPSAAERRDAGATQLADWCEAAVTHVAVTLDGAAGRRDAAAAEVVSVAARHDIEAPSGERALALLREAEREAGTAAERARGAAAEAERRTRERAEMEERIEDEREQIAVLGDLANELRADRFVEYIVQETLELLAARASEELLRISDERYSLVTEEGDFAVVDHANADELRSVKTLSGGETFLASLSLALALSRHVGELATEGLGAKLEAVFIDEGFGTLDPETLDEVIDALERLRADDLIVGVISHVPALAERVRAGLEVHKDEGRSRIVQSVAS